VAWNCGENFEKENRGKGGKELSKQVGDGKRVRKKTGL
jgi:hypothetical protein